MPSKTDFNVSPYYDDYAETKKFHRVIWYQVASINTIPSAIGLMLDMLMNLIFRPKTQTADVLE